MIPSVAHLLQAVVFLLLAMGCFVLTKDACLSLNEVCDPASSENQTSCCLAHGQFSSHRIGACGLTRGAASPTGWSFRCCLTANGADHAVNYCNDEDRPCCADGGAVCSHYPRESLKFCCLPERATCGFAAPDAGCCPGLACSDRKQCIRKSFYVEDRQSRRRRRREEEEN